VALASLVSITFAFGAHSDSPEDSGDRKLAREISALKRELQALKARFPDVEANVLQTRDALDEFQEEFDAFRTRLGLALDTGSPQLGIRVEKQRHGRDGLDLSITGSVSSQAEPLSPAEQKQIGKADELLRMGDVATARLFLGKPTTRSVSARGKSWVFAATPRRRASFINKRYRVAFSKPENGWRICRSRASSV
jgi:hypothetical protein